MFLKQKTNTNKLLKIKKFYQLCPDHYACKQLFINQDNLGANILNEIDILEKLKKYDNLIKLHNYLIENSQIYLILDFADSTLQEQINSKQANVQRYNKEEIVKFFVEIGKTQALIYIDEGVAHKDLKPSNILIKDGSQFLSDFGCAEELFKSEQMKNKVAFGTLKWMAPELRDIKNQENIDFFKSDLFSLGMILLYMLTLTYISQVNCSEFFKEAKIRNMRYQYKDKSFSQIINLIAKMLETDPSNRPDASILIQAIQSIEENQDI